MQTSMSLKISVYPPFKFSTVQKCQLHTEFACALNFTIKLAIQSNPYPNISQLNTIHQTNILPNIILLLHPTYTHTQTQTNYQMKNLRISNFKPEWAPVIRTTLNLEDHCLGVHIFILNKSRSGTSQDPEQVKYNFKLLYLSKHAGTIVDWWQENNKALSCFQKKGCICLWITLLVCYNIINTKSLFYWKSPKKCYRPCSSFKFISVFLKKSYKTALPANRVNLAR